MTLHIKSEFWKTTGDLRGYEIMEKNKMAIAGTGMLRWQSQNVLFPIQNEYSEKYLKEMNFTATLDVELTYSDADFIVTVLINTVGQSVSMIA